MESVTFARAAPFVGMPRASAASVDDDVGVDDEDASGATAAPSSSHAARERSRDVVSSRPTFADVHLDGALVAALRRCGYDAPSPIQLAATPLGRFGADVIAHAKSGTGKTITFVVITLERIKASSRRTQALTLSPTRECAMQTHSCFVKLIAAFDTDDARRGIDVAVVVGGLPVKEDRARLATQPHVVVGTPGRTRQLLDEGAMACDGVRLLILDEADALLTGTFERDVLFAYSMLPERKQMCAFSATYPQSLLDALETLMRVPQKVMLCESTIALHGVRQFYSLIDQDETKSLAEVIIAKEARLLKIFADVAFHQAVVFVRRTAWGEALAKRLTSQGVKSSFTAGTLPQTRRMQVMEEMRTFQLRVLVSTDLTARGIDLTHVNLVVNLDVPPSGATYMHRIGRTGRFGSYGIAVAVLTGRELETLKASIVAERGGDIQPLPDVIPANWYTYELDDDDATAFETLKNAPIEVIDEECEDTASAAATGETKENVRVDAHSVAPDAPHVDDTWYASTDTDTYTTDRTPSSITYAEECAAYDAYWYWFHRRHPASARQPRELPPPPGCPRPWIIPALHDDLVRLPFVTRDA